MREPTGIFWANLTPFSLKGNIDGARAVLHTVAKSAEGSPQAQVRTTPYRPRSCANFSLVWSYICIRAAMHGPACTFWANPASCSPQAALRQAMRAPAPDAGAPAAGRTSSYFAVQEVACYDTEDDCVGSQPSHPRRPHPEAESAAVATIPAGSALVADRESTDAQGRIHVRFGVAGVAVWACTEAPDGATALQVRSTPSWPGSWANRSLVSLYFHRNARANLHLLGQPDTFHAAAGRGRPRDAAERPPAAAGGGGAPWAVCSHHFACRPRSLMNSPH